MCRSFNVTKEGGGEVIEAFGRCKEVTKGQRAWKGVSDSSLHMVEGSFDVTKGGGGEVI